MCEAVQDLKPKSVGSIRWILNQWYQKVKAPQA